MELTLEAYRNIVSYVGSRADIATLCRISPGFRRVGERALYNTLFMRIDPETTTLCKTLTNSPRLAFLVDALTISLSEEEDSKGSDESRASENEERPIRLEEMNWQLVALALERTKNLRYLNVHIKNRSSSAVAWVLDKCTFRLHRFHCDFDWDSNLVAFLINQPNLEDLYIQDYKDNSTGSSAAASSSRHSHLDICSIPKLSILECTFSEAAMVLVPGRPVTHLKTCFSRSEISEKRSELLDLLTKVKLSSGPLRSLDVADSSYDEQFSLDLLSAIAKVTSFTSNLRHLGTFALPVNGRERLQCYGLLMRFRQIQSIELEVSEWEPPPTSPAALRALAGELHLYNPSIIKVIFVCNFDRTVVTVVEGICRLDPDVCPDLLWREI